MFPYAKGTYDISVDYTEAESDVFTVLLEVDRLRRVRGHQNAVLGDVG